MNKTGRVIKWLAINWVIPWLVKQLPRYTEVEASTVEAVARHLGGDLLVLNGVTGRVSDPSDSLANDGSRGPSSVTSPGHGSQRWGFTPNVNDQL